MIIIRKVKGMPEEILPSKCLSGCTYKMFFILLALSQALLINSENSTHKLQLIEVNCHPENEVLSNLTNSGLTDVLSTQNENTKVIVDYSDLPRVLKSLESSDIKYNVVVDNLLDLIEAEAKYMKQKRSRRRREAGYMDWTSYHSLDDIEGYLGWLNMTRPDLVSVFPVARTEENRMVYVVKVSDPLHRGPKKQIWVEGGIHAREWISPAVTTFLLHQVVTSPEFRPLLEKTDWYFVPVANPDGYVFSFTGGRARLWRKNRRKNSGMFPNRCKGIDLNRNWNLKWGVGASSKPCSEVYKGKTPFSEPETKGLRNAMERAGEIDLFITFHSFGQAILYPWGWTVKPPKNERALSEVGRRFVDAVNQVSGGRTKYELGGSARKYGLASGASDDWAFGSLKAPYSYTIELRDNGVHGFLLPENQIFDTVKESVVGTYCMVSYLTETGLCSDSYWINPIQPRSYSRRDADQIIFKD